MATLVTDFLNIDIINKSYYVHAKRDDLQHQLLIFAKAGQDIYENEYNKLNNLPYVLKENGHISIQEIFKDNWNDFKNYCISVNKPIRQLGFISTIHAFGRDMKHNPHIHTLIA